MCTWRGAPNRPHAARESTGNRRKRTSPSGLNHGYDYCRTKSTKKEEINRCEQRRNFLLLSRFVGKRISIPKYHSDIHRPTRFGSLLDGIDMELPAKMFLSIRRLRIDLVFAIFLRPKRTRNDTIDLIPYNSHVHSPVFTGLVPTLVRLVCSKD